MTTTPVAPPEVEAASDATPFDHIKRGLRRQPVWTGIDAVAVLTTWLILLFALPERLVYPPLGAAGAPAGILAWLIAAWWGLNRLVPQLVSGGRRQPLRQALVVVFCACALAYLFGLLRDPPGVQQRASDRFLLRLLGMSGVALVVADGVRTRERLDTLLRRLTVAGAALGVMGLVHSFLGFAYAERVTLPGLALNRELFSGVRRAGVERITGTANHPIAYGVTLGLLLPLAVHYASVATRGPERQWRVAVAATIGIAIPITVSRSAVICVVAAFVVLWLSWPWRRRVNAIGVLGAGLVIVQAVLPGRILGLFRLFTDLNRDNSLEARTRDYEIVFDHILERPWFGLGPGTFLPDEFVQLDNQALKLMLEVGFVGCVAFIFLYVTGMRLAQSARRGSADEGTRDLCQTLTAMLVAAFVVCFTFDAYGYSFYWAVVFVTLGAAGALWRLTYSPSDPRTLAHVRANGDSAG
ncbi:MAG: O-antigen ligase family protein [Acidimicrobiales bacterium]